MDTIKSYQITDGPSRDTLWDHMKYMCDRDVKRPVTFTLNDEEVVDFLHIVSIQHEDGSGYSFIMTGNAPGHKGREKGEVQFKMYYNAKRRKGFLEIKEYKPA